MKTLFKLVQGIHFLATSQEHSAMLVRWLVWFCAAWALIFGHTAPVLALVVVKTVWLCVLVVSKNRYQRKEERRRAELAKLQREPWPSMATVEGQPDPNQK